MIVHKSLRLRQFMKESLDDQLVCFRAVEDFGVIYLGSASFKIARLLFVAMFSVHLFACIFFRVKVVSADSPDDVALFYTSKNVAEDVSTSGIACTGMPLPFNDNYCIVEQDLGQQYVSSASLFFFFINFNP
jgi:hypothetical protein